eukprot:CAMPEP_0114544562 /NCGR_PEP_ID=MMETSP0114-20121206/2942_1 /TAXON_ID=31324 /ORGANISM="Goniomonas sp, Strain m" /LENGTH=126 /DNA_ID=CAMNT_0001728949 /DNA_START=663 /DNA_END=1045 /DNA_ORIENTATION=-
MRRSPMGWSRCRKGFWLRWWGSTLELSPTAPNPTSGSSSPNKLQTFDEGEAGRNDNLGPALRLADAASFSMTALGIDAEQKSNAFDLAELRSQLAQLSCPFQGDSVAPLSQLAVRPVVADPDAKWH